MTLRVLELFAGAGGMALGFHRAGLEPVALAEWDPHAQCVLRHRFPEVPLYGDVRDVNGREIVTRHGRVDLVSFGAPCQDLSVAGKRAGLDGDRSSLFHEGIRLWEETGATYALYENVCGALSSHQGADFARVLSAFVGRAVSVPVRGWGGRAKGGLVSGPAGVAAWRVLDAQYFGVPQRRRRVFVLGARPGGVRPEFVLLEPDGVCWDPAAGGEAGEGVAGAIAGGAGTGGVNVLGTLTARMCISIGARDVEEGVIQVQDEVVGALDTECWYTKATFQSVVSGHVVTDRAEGVVFAHDCPPCKDCGEPWCNAHRAHYADCPCVGPTQEERIVVPALPASGAGTARTGNERTEAELVVVQKAVAFHPTQTGLADEGIAPTLKTDLSHQMGPVVAPGRPRRLMPVECERLMGWPDDHTLVPDPRGKPMADSHRYKMCGNGVVAHVAEWIGRRLIQADALAELSD